MSLSSAKLPLCRLRGSFKNHCVNSMHVRLIHHAYFARALPCHQASSLSSIRFRPHCVIRGYSSAAPRIPLMYEISASFCPKKQSFGKNHVYHFDPSSRNFTIRRTPWRSGQDAYFASSVGSTPATAFGVADGVGGWHDHGIDPALVSHGLCNSMAKAAGRFPDGFTSATLEPKALLQSAYEEVLQDESIPGGSTTACIAVANETGHVEIAK